MSVRAHTSHESMTTAALGSTIPTTQPAFPPKFLISYWNGRNVTGTATQSIRRGIGISDGTNHRCVFTTDQNAATEGETDRGVRNDAVCAVILPGTADPSTLEGRISSVFTSLGVTWTIDDALASALQQLYLVGGGSDITGVSVQDTVIPTSTASPLVINLPPEVEDPDFVFLATVGGATAMNGVGVDSALGFGWAVIDKATGIITQYTQCNWSDDGPVSTSTRAYEQHGECISGSNGATAINLRGVCTSMAGTQIEIALTEVDGVNTPPLIVLVVKGGSWAAGSFATSTVGAADQVLTTNHRPAGMFFASACAPISAADTPIAYDKWSIGTWAHSGFQINAHCSSRDSTTSAETQNALTLSTDTVSAVYTNYTDATLRVLSGRMQVVGISPTSARTRMQLGDAANNAGGWFSFGKLEPYSKAPDDEGRFWLRDQVRYYDLDGNDYPAYMMTNGAQYGDTVSIAYVASPKLDSSGLLTLTVVNGVEHNSVSSTGGLNSWAQQT